MGFFFQKNNQIGKFQTDDIEIILQNPTEQTISVGLFDTVEDKRPIKVGSIAFSATTQSFFYSNLLILGNTKYILDHYRSGERANTAVIYNFKKGVYLSELENVILYPQMDKNKFILYPLSTVHVTISTAK